jgi:hypothetical protein
MADLVEWGGAAMIEVGSRYDPDITDRQRLIRGARRRDVLLDLEARRVITKRMRDAAEQFLEDCSIAAGASAADEISDNIFILKLAPIVQQVMPNIG